MLSRALVFLLFVLTVELTLHKPVSTVPAVPILPAPSPLKPKPSPENPNALDEVNAARAKHRLRPYILNEDLCIGALAAARYRARHLISGHTKNDFSFLPEGTTAKAAGCAAWPPEYG